LWRIREDVKRVWAPGSEALKKAEDDLAAVDKQKKELETAYPAVLDEPLTPNGATSQARVGTPENRQIDLATETTHVAALEAKVTALNAQLVKLQAESSA